jgi:hypothetical protein
MNSFDDLAPDCLGKAGLVYEHVLVSTVVHVYICYYVSKSVLYYTYCVVLNFADSTS